MSEALTSALLATAEDRHAPLGPAVTAYSAAMTAVRAQDDLEARMRAIAELHLAAEAAAEAFKAAAATARAKLAEAFEASGCPGLYLAHHHVTPTEGARRVIVTDQAALAARHPELMTTPAPKPDTAAIAKLLRTGSEVAGCTLSNGGETGIRITATTKD